MAEMNTVMQLAYDYLESTNTVVFLTGKAGTGKTTFLQNLRQTSQKKLAVVAPTGVAAINAGGMTIHSFFQLGFGPIIPLGTERPEVHFNTEKKDLLANLELLVIDEVSMVRPDVLDQIDLILRNIKGSQYPFGGVQLLLIGDLSQLSPIIKDDEWGILRPYYNTPYFFSSRVMQKAPYVRIELNHVFRQKEQAFVDILNEVRNNTISPASLQTLNNRHVPGFKPTAEEPYITLTTHNSIAQKINNEYLEALNAREVEYTATVSGDFPRDAYPTDISLKLKIGSQVMFVKNDSSAEKLYYNGKIGTVTALDDSMVYVQCGINDKEIAVEAMEWTNINYQMEGDEINETNSGSFAQIPLKLAWSITIHKSQGLSFDKAIIDVSESFAHGQAYVALSRCRSLAGMVLRNPIAARNIISDPAVTRFNEQSAQIAPDEKRLEQDRYLYQQYLLSELFNFGPLQTKLKEFTSLLPNLEQDIIGVAEKFNRQLKAERSQQASGYFLEKLTGATETLHLNLPFLIDKSKEKAAKADQLIIWLMNRIQLLQYFAANPFTKQTYLEQVKNKATTHNRSYLKALNALPNEELYNELLTWREKLATSQKIMQGMVFTEKTMAAIAEKLPATLKNLSGIKGVGPQKANQYGTDIITLIRAYQQGPENDQASLF
ncbi:MULTISPECIES: HRDC domain-containing protein [unclassified Mucilaginibacter]|uniref:HRDC domain-containing protein n=1 Tax=unclassified Mucilaginibacter TaxID=2617802 RepID=UPI002AC923F9|nr:MULTISPECIES: HRDC domain-containing protein [unclassified Mucilaginibacter]MEB0261594.1 HRDC domain-containing protein [Mucilaginibacter sp. 10I4]MEB0277152.1 HRDC domain-containing protein [Mucilaginibacter sp. 10B2]MEB0301402.1 HRDC domain-containing protein [Mucilaginibacter sp. 5C4]WPX25252.1 HRDC domain-containing protein [Mucilaginibacter sp. 5C4]